jgi:hypothetical protein
LEQSFESVEQMGSKNSASFQCRDGFLHVSKGELLGPAFRWECVLLGDGLQEKEALP